MDQFLPKVSVIIPVYNAENYLRECLDSVINQTLREIEILCVDDGSTDSSLEILREYEAKDERVTVLTQKNQFAGVARNHGMELARGQYYSFLDADDFFEPEMLEKMLRQAERFDADICLCGSDDYDTASDRCEPKAWRLNLREVKEESFNAHSIGDVFSVTTPAAWTKLFSASFVKKNGLLFQPTPRINDIYFTFCALSLAERIVFVDEVLVHYRVNHGGNLQSGVFQTPELICAVLLDIKARLEKESCWEAVKDSFINAAVRNLDYNLQCVNDNAEAKRKLLTAIDKRCLHELGIESLPIDRVTKTDPYNRVMLEVLKLRCEDPELPAVSVVVPVFNAEEYVEKCLQSLLAQTLEDVEIICVDDASTDGSLAILRRYADHNPHVRLIENQTNAGAVCARRTGALASRGKYIMFADPDDYLDPSACETAYQEILSRKTDILQFTIGVEDHSNDETTRKWLENYLKPKNQRLNRKELKNGLFLKRDVATALVGKIYSAPICKLAYQYIPELYCNMGEDQFQQFYFSCFADSYSGVSTKPLYWYRRGLGVSNSGEMHLSKYKAYCEMSRLYENAAQFADKVTDKRFTRECAEALGTRMCEDCARNWKRQVPEEEKAEAFILFWNSWRSFPGWEAALERMTGQTARELHEKFIGVPKYVKTAARYEADANWKPAVSVVVPVYNVEDYLRECLDSIVHQTLREIEILCVNDGSTDGGLSILEEYCANDSRITVISQANGGLSAARNSGMRLARGEYLYFMDSDDWLDANALETASGLAAEKDLDAVIFGVESFYESEELQRDHSFSYGTVEEITKVFSGVEFIAEMKDKKLYSPSVCRGLWRTAMLKENGIAFKEGIIHEDNLFSFLCYMAANRVVQIPDVFYHRRVRPASTMTNPKTAKNAIGYFGCAEGMLAYALQDTYEPGKEKEILRAYLEMFNAAKRDYKAISEEEQGKVIFSGEVENELFKQLVVNSLYVERFRVQIKRQKKALETIKTSRSYRIGRMITWLPRKLRGGVRCFKEHGLRYTIRRLFMHLAGKT